GDGGVGDGARGVVCVVVQRVVRLVPGPCGDPWDAVQQGRGDQGGVHVDAGQVQGPAVGGLVQFGAGGGPPLGPGGLVPAVPEQHRVLGVGGGMGAYPVEGGGEGGGVGQVESGERQAGGGGV